MLPDSLLLSEGFSYQGAGFLSAISNGRDVGQIWQVVWKQFHILFSWSTAQRCNRTWLSLSLGATPVYILWEEEEALTSGLSGLLQVSSEINFFAQLHAAISSRCWVSNTCSWRTGCLRLILFSQFQANSGWIHLHRLFGALAAHGLEADEFTCT